jgi:hypothetical protein
VLADAEVRTCHAHDRRKHNRPEQRRKQCRPDRDACGAGSAAELLSCVDSPRNHVWKRGRIGACITPA